MMEKKCCRVSIYGSSYLLASDDSEEAVKKVATLVDEIMHEIAQGSGNGKDTRQIAILTAIRLAERVIAAQAYIDQAKRCEAAIIEKIMQLVTI